MGATDPAKARVGTLLGNSVTFGNPVEIGTERGNTLTSTYDPVTNTHCITFRMWPSPYTTRVTTGTVSGDSITFGPLTVLSDPQVSDTSSTYDSVSNKLVIAYRQSVGTLAGTAVTYVAGSVSTNLTDSNFIGVSDGDYADGETASVQPRGAVDDAQSGLTPEATYYVQVDGSINTTVDNPSVLAGTAIESDLLLIKE